MLCEQQTARLRPAPYGFSCELQFLRVPVFAVQVAQDRATIQRVDAYIADASLERVREQTIERYGQPTSIERDPQGARVWRWLLPPHGTIISLSLTRRGVRIGFVRADDFLASDLSPLER